MDKKLKEVAEKLKDKVLFPRLVEQAKEVLNSMVMKGTLHKTEQGWFVASSFSPDAFPLHPKDSEIQNMMGYEGKEVEFKLVQTLKDGATYTSEKGWNENPIDKTYALLVFHNTTETWKDLEEEYMKDEYPVFGGPFTDALTPWEWLEKYYNTPTRKK